MDNAMTQTARTEVYFSLAIVGSRACYLSGMFGPSAIECKTLSLTYKPWAQYRRAAIVTFLEKGKRKPRRAVVSPNSEAKPGFLVVLDRIKAIKVDDWLEGTGDGHSRSRYMSFDPRYESEFGAKLDGVECLVREGC